MAAKTNISTTLTLILIGLLSLSSCRKAQTNSALSVAPANATPLLIDAGTPITVGGITFTPPYFTESQLSLTWGGPGALTIFIVTFTTSDNSYKCALSGDPLHAAFPTQNSISPAGQVIILPPAAGVQPTPVGTSIVGCSGVSIPNPPPKTGYNIPLTVTVEGGIIPDPNNLLNVTGRATATAAITLK